MMRISEVFWGDEDLYQPHYHECRRCGAEIPCYGEETGTLLCETWEGDNDGCVCEGEGE